VSCGNASHYMCNQDGLFILFQNKKPAIFNSFILGATTIACRAHYPVTFERSAQNSGLVVVTAEPS